MDIAGGVSAPQTNDEYTLPLFIIGIIAIILIGLIIYAIISFIAFIGKNIADTPSTQKGHESKLQCQICNSQDLIKENDYIICQQCGCKYSVDEAKNLLKGS